MRWVELGLRSWLDFSGAHSNVIYASSLSSRRSSLRRIHYRSPWKNYSFLLALGLASFSSSGWIWLAFASWICSGKSCRHRGIHQKILWHSGHRWRQHSDPDRCIGHHFSSVYTRRGERTDLFSASKFSSSFRQSCHPSSIHDLTS